MSGVADPLRAKHDIVKIVTFVVRIVQQHLMGDYRNVDHSPLIIIVKLDLGLVRAAFNNFLWKVVKRLDGQSRSLVVFIAIDLGLKTC